MRRLERRLSTSLRTGIVGRAGAVSRGCWRARGRAPPTLPPTLARNCASHSGVGGGGDSSWSGSNGVAVLNLSRTQRVLVLVLLVIVRGGLVASRRRRRQSRSLRSTRSLGCSNGFRCSNRSCGSCILCCLFFLGRRLLRRLCLLHMLHLVRALALFEQTRLVHLRVRERRGERFRPFADELQRRGNRGCDRRGRCFALVVVVVLFLALFLALLVLILMGEDVAIAQPHPLAAARAHLKAHALDASLEALAPVEDEHILLIAAVGRAHGRTDGEPSGQQPILWDFQPLYVILCHPN